MKAVDLFSGAGGFTEGARRAGLRVVWAANHDPRAVDAHARNHPDTEHSCQDLRQADFTKLPKYDVLLASPACQGHTRCSQPRRRPKHDVDRSTAWAVIDCAEATRPRAIVVENVAQFRRWSLFSVWRSALETLGYFVDMHTLDAADFGVPQNRVRLFITATRSRRTFRLETQSKRSRVPSSTVIDPNASGWAPITSKSDDTRARVSRGRIRFGRRFLIHQVTDHSGRSLDAPIGTITTARAHWHLVDGDQIRPLTVRELARAQGFRDSFALPDGIALGTRLVGNAVPPPLAEAVTSSLLEVA